MGKKRTSETSPEPPRAATRLGDLLRRHGLTPFEPALEAPPDAGPETGLPPPGAGRASAPPPAGALAAARPPPTRFHVHFTRKGRGGKLVTVVGGLNLPPAELEELARRLRRAFGCGASVEEGEIVLQGQHVERVREWLQKR